MQRAKYKEEEVTYHPEHGHYGNNNLLRRTFRVSKKKREPKKVFRIFSEHKFPRFFSADIKWLFDVFVCALSIRSWITQNAKFFFDTGLSRFFKKGSSVIITRSIVNCCQNIIKSHCS